MTSVGDDDQPSVSIHAEGSAHTRMPIVGQGDQTNIENQTNFYGSAEDPDIRVELVHERDVIDAGIGGRQVISVEVTNLGPDARELSLRVEGVPAEIGTVEPRVVPVNPGKVAKARLVLLCTPTEPEAGRRRLLVRATDTHPKLGSKHFRKSNEKTLDVPARPKVAISAFEPPTSKVSDPGTYQTTVRVRNTGNTRLSASLRYPDQAWIAKYAAQGLADQVVTPDQISFGAGADDLGPGEEHGVAVEVQIPDRPLRDRRWLLPLMVQASRDDAAPYLETFDFHQTGLLSELPHVLARARNWLGAWAAHPVASRRGVLVGVFLTVLMVGAVVGLVISPAPGAESASSPVPSALTSSVPTPLAVPPLPRFSYESLPCAPGTVVIFLATVRDPLADTRTQEIAFYEHNRIWLINLGRAPGEQALPDLVHISAWSPECPTAGGFAGDNQENHFIWYGPVPADAKDAICATLRKPVGDNHCHPHVMPG